MLNNSLNNELLNLTGAVFPPVNLYYITQCYLLGLSQLSKSTVQFTPRFWFIPFFVLSVNHQQLGSQVNSAGLRELMNMSDLHFTSLNDSDSLQHHERYIHAVTLK